MPEVRFPDGTVVHASSLAERRADNPQRHLGLYLDQAWEPDWPAIMIDWPDFGLPLMPEDALSKIAEAFDRARSGERLEVGCRGGLGRTGTVLACFAVICGLPADAAIDWVRAGYDRRAIETPEQEKWVAWFACRWAERENEG